MATPVPALDRAVRLLRLLSERPLERFTVSELARELELSKATCHSLVMALWRADVLDRDEQRKAYCLGSAAVALGSAAAARFRSLPATTAAAHQLAAQTGLPCIASAVIGGAVVTLAVAGTPQLLGGPVRVGHSVPFAPPMGLVFVAWAPPAAVDEWFGRRPDLDARERLRLDAAIQTSRALGYAVGLHSRHEDEVGLVLQQLRQPNPDAERVDLALRLADLLSGKSYVPAEPELEPARVDFLAAPVFEADGSVEVALTVVTSSVTLDERTLERLADELLGASGSLTSQSAPSCTN